MDDALAASDEDRLGEVITTALERHRTLLREEIDLAREHGFTPPISLLHLSDGAATPELLDVLEELLAEAFEARARLQRHLVQQASAPPPPTHQPQSPGLVARIAALIDGLDDILPEDEDPRTATARLQREADRRKATIDKLVAKAYDQGRTIARLRGMLGALAGESRSAALAEAALGDLPDYDEIQEHPIVLAEDDWPAS
ncbi:MAG: hypothetical protein ACOCYN_01965 [Planctomycetota bacterium]